MSNPRIVVTLTSLAVIASLAWWRLAVAQNAGGGPAMYYAGTLHQDGAAVDGRRRIQLALWRDPVSSSDGDRLCLVAGEQTPVDDGHFRIALATACSDGLRAHSDVWVEIVVDDVSLGRTKIGAVPYAQEAAVARAAAAPLSDQLVPRGLIAAFASACPAGWREYEALRGRFPRGEPAGNPGSLDTGGSDHAVLVAHSHTISGSTDGGDHAHGAGSLATSAVGDHSHGQLVTANPGHCPGSGIVRTDYTGDTRGDACPYAQGWSTGGAGGHAHAVAGTTASAGHSHAVRGNTSADGVAGAGMNVPAYREVLYCVKQ